MNACHHNNIFRPSVFFRFLCSTMHFQWQFQMHEVHGETSKGKLNFLFDGTEIKTSGLTFTKVKFTHPKSFVTALPSLVNKIDLECVKKFATSHLPQRFAAPPAMPILRCIFNIGCRHVLIFELYQTLSTKVLNTRSMDFRSCDTLDLSNAAESFSASNIRENENSISPAVPIPLTPSSSSLTLFKSDLRHDLLFLRCLLVDDDKSDCTLTSLIWLFWLGSGSGHSWMVSQVLTGGWWS